MAESERRTAEGPHSKVERRSREQFSLKGTTFRKLDRISSHHFITKIDETVQTMMEELYIFD